MADDQAATFTTDILRQMKANHEIWVSRKLAEEQKTQPVRIRRVKQNVPDFLVRLTTGNEVLDTVSNAMAYAFDHDELKSQEEVDVIGGFFQLAQEWGDLCNDLEAGSRVQTTYELGQSLHAVEEAGFFVFGGREVQFIEGGAFAGSSDWPLAVMRVLRKDNPLIMHVNLEEMNKVDAQQNAADPPIRGVSSENCADRWSVPFLAVR